MSTGRFRDIDLDIVGPQRADESLLSRRVRFHQSWYRAAVLGLSAYGMTPGKAPRALGSILTDADATAGRNFTSEASERLYGRRRAAGWGVDPVRCTKYLTSSQALTLNLFGPIQESPRWAARTLALLLDRSDFERVTGVWVEFAPRRRSKYLNDMTRVDVLLQVRTRSGEELIAIETKYADRFNSRRVDIDRPPYRRLAMRVGLWSDPDVALGAAHLNQLVRCHALAAAVAEELVGPATVANVLVLHHRDDTATRQLVNDYANHLADHSLIAGRTLDEFVNALALTARTGGQRKIARALDLRYIAESESEALWLESGDRSFRVPRAAGVGSMR